MDFLLKALTEEAIRPYIGIADSSGRFSAAVCTIEQGIGMIKDVIVERIPVEDGTLIINHHYMALQTPDGVMYPADMDEY